MKPSQVKDAVKLCIKAKRPVFLWGSVGIGKSQVIAQVAKELNYQLTDVRAVLLDPVDFRGLPHINGNNKTHWSTPEFLPTEGQGILFLDELNSAPPLVQASCYQLILDRKLGEYTLPDGWIVIGAGNRETDRAIVNRMSSALSNRLIHINFDTDIEDWITWALNNNILTEIIAFIRFRPVNRKLKILEN